MTDKWRKKQTMRGNKSYLRRWISFALLLAVVLSGMPTQSAQAAGRPKTVAHAYYVLDAQSGKKILSSHAGDKIYPASTVKLMTALVVLEHAKTNQTFTYTKQLKKKIPADASSLNLKVNRTYTVLQYLHMLLIVSDAASATTLAEGVAGSQKQFVAWMNEKAAQLGMKHTSFDNPIGLDKGSGYNNTYTTASDFGKLSKAAMENKTIRAIVAKKKYKVRPVGVRKSFVIQNTNAFYSTYKKLVKHADYRIIGSKTGTTRAAGHALVATAVDTSGHEVICAFYGKADSERMYRDIKKLLDYAFSQYNVR